RLLILLFATFLAVTVLAAISARHATLFLPLFFFHHPAPTEIYTLSLHDALPIFGVHLLGDVAGAGGLDFRGLVGVDLRPVGPLRSEEHTSELQSLTNLVCRLLLEKKKKTAINDLPF